MKNIDIQQQQNLSEARLSAIMHHSPVAIVFTDTDLRVLKTNTQFVKQFGYNEDIYSLCNLLSQTSKEGFCTKLRCLNTIKQQGQTEYEIETRHKDGHILWILIRGTLINQAEPNQGMVWTLEDISQQRLAQEQQQLAATVFEVSGEAMIIFNAKGMIENINPAMHYLIEYSLPELHQQPISNLFDSANNHLFINEILNLVSQQGQWKGELCLRKKNNSSFPARMTINSIKRPNNSISHFVAIIADISEYKAQEKALKHRANHDPLTGLPNRNEFFVRLQDSLSTAERNQYKVALLYLDLDGFKLINDTLGHGRGDEVLQEVATKLKNCIREIDTVARLGGDEFTIILNGTDEEHITTTAERIIQTISIHLESSLFLSISIGIALFPNDATNAVKLLQYADRAMYKAKHQGKQSYFWHNSETK